MVKRRSKKMLIPGFKVLGILMTVAVPSTSKAAILFYNGDYDSNDAYANSSKVPVSLKGTGSTTSVTSLVFDDFIVPVGQSWTIASLFTNNQVAYTGTLSKATWQIDSGMAPGSAGTVLFSGDSTAVITAGHAADGNNYIDPEKNVSVAVTGVTLTAGLYWFAVAPDSPGTAYGDQAYIETTSGANAVGLPTGLDGNSYLNNNLSGPGKVTYAFSTLDFSGGINGTAVVLATPEPTCLALIGFGTVGILGRRRRSIADRII